MIVFMFRPGINSDLSKIFSNIRKVQFLTRLRAEHFPDEIRHEEEQSLDGQDDGHPLVVVDLSVFSENNKNIASN